MFSRLFGHQPLYFEPALHLLQYIDGEPANNYSLTVVPKCSQPVIDSQCLHLMKQPRASLEMVHSHSRIDATIKSSSTQPSLISTRRITPPRLPTAASPIPNSNVVFGSCDHNGGVISNENGLKITVPEGAIKGGDLVIFHIAAGLFGPFVLPSNCQTNLASPYYWIGVSGSYHFQKPIQVEFEHFGGCDPSHYQLLCCEDDNESYTMQPVDCELSFYVRDNISWCTFYTNHFCVYCVYHNVTDIMNNQVGAFYLKPRNYQYLNQFAVEVWFSFATTLCMESNKEWYTRRNMVLDSSHIIVASYGSIDAESYLMLDYVKPNFTGWYLGHSKSSKLYVREVNFWDCYNSIEQLKLAEEMSMFPPRFIINVARGSNCTMDLHTNISVTLIEKETAKLNISFNLFVSVPTRAFTDSSKDTSLLFVSPHHWEDNKPTIKDLELYLKHISSNWKEISRHLGISKHHISTINIVYMLVKVKCSKMLRIWLERSTSPSWCHFVEALIDCGLYDVAEEAKKHLQISPSNVIMGSPDTGKGSLKKNTKEKLQKKYFKNHPVM